MKYWYRDFFKRVIDIIMSFSGLIMLSPILILISAIILTTSKGSILFKQRRVGKGKVEFNIYKFRTMFVDTPSNIPTHLLNNPESFITPVGNFLRKTSLDELPQLLNILYGEMSVVGPRPALWNQYDLIELRDKYKANDILPGLTGLAQIRGRDELSIDIKAKYDGEYLEKMSLYLDAKIFWQTIFKVAQSDGVVEGKIK